MINVPLIVLIVVEESVLIVPMDRHHYQPVTVTIHYNLLVFLPVNMIVSVQLTHITTMRECVLLDLIQTKVCMSTI